MSRVSKLRIALFAGGVLSAVFAPPWVVFAFIIVLALRFRAAEAIVLGLLMDLTWLPAAAPFTVLPLCTLGAVAIVWLLEPVRIEFLS